MAKKKSLKNKYAVVIDKRTGMYLQEHRLYGSYPVRMRVVLTSQLHEARHFLDVATAIRHMQSRLDYRDPMFDWKIQGMEATEIDEEVYPVQLKKE